MEKHTEQDLAEEYDEFEKESGKMQDKWQLAKQFAANAHAGQRRDEGTPYFEHVYRVALEVEPNEDSPSSSGIIALLHDIIEDTDKTYEDIKNVFGKYVADGVQILSKDKTAQNFDEKEYWKAIISDENSKLGVIKLADRINNISSLVNCPRPQKQKEYMEETKTVFLPLFREQGQLREEKKLFLKYCDKLEEQVKITEEKIKENQFKDMER